MALKTIKELERKNCHCHYCQGKRQALKDVLGLIDEREIKRKKIEEKLVALIPKLGCGIVNRLIQQIKDQDKELKARING